MAVLLVAGVFVMVRASFLWFSCAVVVGRALFFSCAVLVWHAALCVCARHGECGWPRALWGVRAVCARGAVAHCVRVWAGGCWARPAASVGWRVFLRPPLFAARVVLVWGCAPAGGVAAIFTW